MHEFDVFMHLLVCAVLSLTMLFSLINTTPPLSPPFKVGVFVVFYR